MGKTPHDVENIKNFIENIKNIQLIEDEFITLYNITALFTSVPVDLSLDIIQNKFELDH